MPLILPPALAGEFQTNLSVTARLGTTVTASATINTKGSYSSLIDPTDRESYGIWIRARDVSSANTLENLLLDIAYGPTGGGSEQIIIPNIDCGASGSNTGASGKKFFFPIYIPSGVRVSARCQSNVASNPVSAAIWLCQYALYPWQSGLIQDYGTDLANSRGTLVPNASDAFGAWTQLDAALDRPHRFWTAAVDMGSDTTGATIDCLIELGIGPSSADVTRIFQSGWHENSAEQMTGIFPLIGYHVTPSGIALFGRLAGGGTESRGVIAYGMD